MEEWEALNVDQRIISALERLKFDHPTEIQQRAIPPAVGGRLKSIVGAAETGSGKTLAYGIPIVQRMLNLQQNNNTIKYSRKRRRLNDLESEESDSSENESNSNSDINDDDDSEILDPDMISKFPGLFDIEELDPISMKPIKQKKKKILQTEEENSPLRALILTPTRELALQVKDHISHIINPKNNKEQHQIGIVALVGGMAEAKQLRLLQQRPEIVVGTPGRVWEAMDMGTSQNKIEPDSQIPSFKNKIVDKQQPWHPYDHISNLSGLCCFAVDEADRMVQQGMTKHLGLIVGKIKEEILRRKTEDQQNNGSRKGKIINSQESNKSDYLHLQTFLFSATLTLPKELRVRNSIKKRQKRSEAKEKQREKKFERRRQQEEKELQIQKKKVEKQKEMKNKQKQRKKEKKQKNQGKVNINIDEDDDEMIDFVKKKKRKRSEDDSDNDSTDISNVNIDSEKDSEESRSDVDSERDIKHKNIKQNTNESSVGSESDDDDESESEISDGEISIFNGVKLPPGLDPKILAFFPFTDAPVIVNLSNIQINQFSSSKSSSSISNQQLERVVPTVSATT
ncbi:MAG: putative ATP-dependent RNA helicase DDX24 [Streblomastix strix]|uniref:ATP-dependent RNA helicase n=1 Tax=Streblomastix strix TaxID=222440 RepID=A0A5J4XAW2_9EUKA|nr:MAG: putative ATP-dependent RNA helicase DDX24 [Streblomastix strix]